MADCDYLAKNLQSVCQYNTEPVCHAAWSAYRLYTVYTVPGWSNLLVSLWVLTSHHQYSPQLSMDYRLGITLLLAAMLCKLQSVFTVLVNQLPSIQTWARLRPRLRTSPASPARAPPPTPWSAPGLSTRGPTSSARGRTWPHPTPATSQSTPRLEAS